MACADSEAYVVAACLAVRDSRQDCSYHGRTVSLAASVQQIVVGCLACHGLDSMVADSLVQEKAFHMALKVGSRGHGRLVRSCGSYPCRRALTAMTDGAHVHSCQDPTGRRVSDLVSAGDGVSNMLK